MNSIQNHSPIVGKPASQASATLHTRWRDEADTETCTRQLAAWLQARPAASGFYIALHGDLGAGKTTFTRHLLRALGVQGRIKSPTYAVVEAYETPALTIWHFDFYRFDDPREWEEAGFRELFASPGLKVAEWPERAEGHIPTADLALQIQTLSDDGVRDVTLTAQSRAGHEMLQALQAKRDNDQEESTQS